MSIKSKHEKRIKDFQLLEEKLRLRELNRKKHEPEFEIDSSESSQIDKEVEVMLRKNLMNGYNIASDLNESIISKKRDEIKKEVT